MMWLPIDKQTDGARISNRMDEFPKLLLDSGDPDEYREISDLAKEKGQELWGATTNPSLIAKKLSSPLRQGSSEASKKITHKEAFELQKQIVLEIIDIVPGAVSAEVYADETTKAEEMIAQGKEIVTWHERVFVKLPTTIEGFKARTELRKLSVPINNTLVFSQEQIFAICLHEKIATSSQAAVTQKKWPCFISPFVGRLDDIGINGMDLVRNGMKIKELFKGIPSGTPWMLEASVRNRTHIQEGFDSKTELITAPSKAYKDWFGQESPKSPKQPQSFQLTPIPYWEPPEELLQIDTAEQFMQTIESGKLNIRHDLTDKGIVKFANDWKAIIA